MEKNIVQFFHHVLLRDEKIERQIKKFKGAVFFERENATLVFSLIGLYEVLLMLNNLKLEVEVEAKAKGFSVFRKCIYNSTINEQIRQYGGVIEIHQSNGKVNDNLYRLIRISAE